jgi:hypothetical protein
VFEIIRIRMLDMSINMIIPCMCSYVMSMRVYVLGMYMNIIFCTLGGRFVHTFLKVCISLQSVHVAE